MAFWRKHLNPHLSFVFLFLTVILTFFIGFIIGQELYKIFIRTIP